MAGEDWDWDDLMREDRVCCNRLVISPTSTRTEVILLLSLLLLLLLLHSSQIDSREERREKVKGHPQSFVVSLPLSLHSPSLLHTPPSFASVLHLFNHLHSTPTLHLNIMLSPLLILSSLALSTRVAFAQIDTFRGTIEGALHQCQDTGIFFFDSGGSRPLDVLFLPSSSIPDPLRAGTTTLDDAIKYNPLLAISGITTPDASQFDFTLQVATGQVFEVRSFPLFWAD